MSQVKFVRLDGKNLVAEVVSAALSYDGQTAVHTSIRDITEQMSTDEALRKSNELLRFALVGRDARDAIVVHDLDGKTIAWNPGAARIYGWTEHEALTLNVRDRVPEGLRKEALAKLQELSLGAMIEPYCTERLTKEGLVLKICMIATPLVDASGQVYAIATTERLQLPVLNKPIGGLHGS